MGLWGGGNGTLLKSWTPCRYVSAEILGLIWVGRIMLSVFSNFGINLHHRCRGNLGFIPTRPAMRWDFPVWMDRSAQFLLCICGGLSWSYILLSVMYFLMGAEHSLSILKYLGCSPLCRSRAWTSLNVCRCSAPALVFSQRIKIALMSYIYTNIM